MLEIEVSRTSPQQGFEFPNGWGGARRGAGRPTNKGTAGVSHLERPLLASRFPAHVTIRVREKIPNLRRLDPYRVIQRSFQRGCDRFGFRLVHYSVQTNHLHLLAEAKDAVALTRGMQGLQIRTAKALNRLWDRTGSVFDDRYHARILKTPREVRHALGYVLRNAKKHGHVFHGGPDPFSSGRWFDGWLDWPGELPTSHSPVVAPHTWLLRKGWRRFGRIRLSESPRP